MSKLICESVDIYQLPPPESIHHTEENSEVTIGDLHANVIKLLFMLIKEGIASGLSDSDYQQLISIHRTSPYLLRAEDLTAFQQIINKITFKSHCKVRLIGDVVADRCGNDYFTYKLLQAMHKQSVRFEILLSNHDMESIAAYESRQDFNLDVLQEEHAASMQHMQQLIDRGLIKRAEVIDLIHEVYKPNLRALSYCLSKDGQDITLLSHAPSGLNTIDALAKAWNIPYDDSSAAALAKTIESINQRFFRLVDTNSIHKICGREDNLEAYKNSKADFSHKPLLSLIWNRRLDILHRPAMHKGYSLHYGNGHDSQGTDDLHVFLLDNCLGKSHNLHEGEYSVFYFDQEAPQNLTEPRRPFVPTFTPTIEILIQFLNLQYLGTIPPAISTFLDRLNDLDNKSVDLKNRGHHTEASIAKDLYRSLVNESYEFFTRQFVMKYSMEKAAYQSYLPQLVEQFEDDCQQAISKARPSLAKHRGCGAILGNIALALVGVLVFYLAAICINKAITGNWFFFQTESSNRLDKLEKNLAKMTVDEGLRSEVSSSF